MWELEEILVVGAGEVGEPGRAERLVGRSSALQVAYSVLACAVLSCHVCLFLVDQYELERGTKRVERGV